MVQNTDPLRATIMAFSEILLAPLFYPEMNTLTRPNALLGAFAILLLVLLSIQIYADSFRLTPSSLGIVVLMFGVILVLSYPDITKFKVGPSGFEFERQAHELTQKLLTPSVRTERTATITATASVTGIERANRIPAARCLRH